MQSFDIIKKSTPSNTFRVAAIKGTFDLQNETIEERFVGQIDLDYDWQVGLIVGNSGTGKTTIAKELFPDAYITNFTYAKEAVVDDMPQGKTVEEITKAFSSVGFASVPSWLKPYSVLSNGEKMRVDLARAILDEKDFFVFDEFTSVVDRQVAQIGSFAMQKAIRKTNKKFIAVTCHFDVEDWLLPDWVLDTNSMTFRKCEGQKKNRPNINLGLYRIRDKRKYWNIFKKYHYLSGDLNISSQCYVITANNKLCAFVAFLPFLHQHKKNFWRVSRIVVLPDFQGCGIAGKVLDNIVKDEFIKKGKGMLITTSNPMMINSLKRNPSWAMTSKNRKSGGGSLGKSRMKRSYDRITASFQYVSRETKVTNVTA